MDDADRLNCDDVVCDLGGHYACHDLPPPRGSLEHGVQRLVRAVSDYGVTVAEVEDNWRRMTEDPPDPPDSVEVSEG